MKSKVKIAAVSYLNTKPFLYGLQNHAVYNDIELSLEIPARCAQHLIDDTADLGLIPVAAIPFIPNAQIISNYCIGCEGEVNTVCIYSRVPIESIETLQLDYQSRTSVALTKYLLKEHWKTQPTLINATPGYENNIKGTTAALIIGDRTIGLNDQYPYVYDLGKVWQQHTGLPFVFAAWVSNKTLPPTFIKQFNEGLQNGLNKRFEVAQLFESCYPNYSVYDYFFKYIQYSYTKDKKQALKRFLDSLPTAVKSNAL